jgi:dolichol-phosphate mannosyltransferase
MSRSSGAFRLSVVVPCFNEQEVIAATHARLGAALRAIPGAEAEIIFVDDGSGDRTLELLRGIASTDASVRVVALSRNFGHQKAITAGLESATGDAVVLIDADLQDPPEVIAEFVSHWRTGVDVAYGVRRHREGESGFKLFTAHIYYRLMGRVSDHEIPFDAGDFRLLDRAVVDALGRMPERDRFMRGMIAWIGFRQRAVEYDRALNAFAFAAGSSFPVPNS